MKRQCRIIDTFPDFLTYWSSACSRSLHEQIELWRTSYMKKYPELLQKQVQSYEDENTDWRKVARKIFPTFPFRFPLMQKARENTKAICKSICMKASQRLELNFNITLVMYVGIGCGAGWATTYRGQPSILLGLENIAEQKWHTKSKLQGLISHEIGHLAHMNWRDEWETFEKNEEDPLFQLYSEGFAQRCEHVIVGKETWHMARNKEWLSWCQQNKSFLAKEFLKRLKKQASVNDFFGSWFNIQGKSQTAYFLGHSFIRELEKTRSLKEIALLNIKEIRKLAIQFLKSTSKKSNKKSTF